jgi:hypothetical protein
MIDGITVCEKSNHVQPGSVVDGKSNWSRAIFLSPILTYAAHPTYAGRINSKQGTGQWCIIIHAYVRPNAFSTYPSTVGSTYTKPPGSTEPEEMRAEPGQDERLLNLRHKCVEIVRVSEQTNVTVAAVLLASDNVLQTTTLSAEHLSFLMQGSDAH